LRVTAELVSELQAEMEATMAALERLRIQNEEYEKLAAVREQEAQAVRRLVESVISGAHTELERSSRRDQALFFVAGLVASVPLGMLVNLRGAGGVPDLPRRTSSERNLSAYEQRIMDGSL
jgi:hypothetical protein